MFHETRREPNTNMLHKAPMRNETNKIQSVPFQTVTCLNSKLGMITNGVFPDPYLYIVLCLCNHVVDLICLGAEETACVRQDCSPGREAQLCGLLFFLSFFASGCADITCTQTRQCAVWCFLTGSVSGSCTYLVPPSCSPHGSCRSPFSCSRHERWPTRSSTPGSRVGAVCYNTHNTRSEFAHHICLKRNNPSIINLLSFILPSLLKRSEDVRISSPHWLMT